MLMLLLSHVYRCCYADGHKFALRTAELVGSCFTGHKMCVKMKGPVLYYSARFCFVCVRYGFRTLIRPSGLLLQKGTHKLQTTTFIVKYAGGWPRWGMNVLSIVFIDAGWLLVLPSPWWLQTRSMTTPSDSRVGLQAETGGALLVIKRSHSTHLRWKKR